MQGVVVPEVGCIVLQSGGVCAQQQFLPVLHLSNSLHGRFESATSKKCVQFVCIQSVFLPAFENRCLSTAGPDLSSIAYEQVAHRSRIHPSICRRIVQEALMQLNQHIASSSYLQVQHLKESNTLFSMYMCEICLCIAYMICVQLPTSCLVDGQVELPGIGWLHSEGRDVVRLELDEQLLQRFPLKSPLVSLCSIPACFMSASQGFGLQNIT